MMKLSPFLIGCLIATISVGACKKTVKKKVAPKASGPSLPMIRPNVETDFNIDVEKPQRQESTYIDPLSSVIGDVLLGENVFVAPFASIRGDEGQPLFIGDDSNVQDGVVIHALETIDHVGKELPGRTYEVDGKNYAVYIGRRVSMAHQSQVHGPAWIEDDVFVGMQALVFKAHIGRGAVIEPAAKVIGVTVPPGCYVKAGTVLTQQKDADKLPKIDDEYPFRSLNDAVVHVNTSFAESYGASSKPKKKAAYDEHAQEHEESPRKTAVNDHPPESKKH